MSFTIGQRVRITAPGNLHGYQGTIYDIQRPATWFDRLLGEKPWQWGPEALQRSVHPKETAYLVDVDGVGKRPLFGGVFGFPYYWLRPVDEPKRAEDEWAADKVKDLVKPKPMDAEREEAFKRVERLLEGHE